MENNELKSKEFKMVKTVDILTSDVSSLDIKKMKEYLKDTMIFANIEIVYMVSEMNKTLTSFNFNLNEISNYLDKYQIKFYENNQTIFKAINIEDNNELTLFYPHYRVMTIICCKILISMICSPLLIEKTLIEKELMNIEKYFSIFGRLTQNDLKSIFDELVNNETKFISKKIFTKLRYKNNVDKINYLEEWINFLQLLNQQHLNLTNEIEIKYHFSEDLNSYIKKSYSLPIYEYLMDLVNNLGNKGLTSTIYNLEKEKKKIHKFNSKKELNVNEKKLDKIFLGCSNGLNKISTSRQLILAIMYAFTKEFATDFQIKPKVPNTQINQRKLIESLLNHFEYEGNMEQALNESKNHSSDLSISEIKEMILKENKPLSEEITKYMQSNRNDFKKMIKYRKKKYAK